MQTTEDAVAATTVNVAPLDNTPPTAEIIDPAAASVTDRGLTAVSTPIDELGHIAQDATPVPAVATPTAIDPSAAVATPVTAEVAVPVTTTVEVIAPVTEAPIAVTTGASDVTIPAAAATAIPYTNVASVSIPVDATAATVVPPTEGVININPSLVAATQATVNDAVAPAVVIEAPAATPLDTTATPVAAAEPAAVEPSVSDITASLPNVDTVPINDATATLVTPSQAPVSSTSTDDRLAAMEARYDQLLRSQDADRAYVRQLELSMQEIATKNMRMLSGVSNMMVNYSSTLSNLANDVNTIQNALNIPMNDRPKARLQVSLSSEPVNELSLYGTLHSETHPDFPDTFELRRKDLKESTPEKTHWDTITIDDEGFMTFLKQHFLASKYEREQWCYVTLTNLPPDGSMDATAAASAAAAVAPAPMLAANDPAPTVDDSEVQTEADVPATEGQVTDVSTDGASAAADSVV